MSNIKVCGFKVHVLIPKPLRDKLGHQTYQCGFKVPIDNAYAYIGSFTKRRLIESRDVVF